METKPIREWKKVFVSDIGYISYELKEIVKPNAVIFLEGPMGSGKTTFAKDFLGQDEETMSPSYSIIYEAGVNIHADLYRIEKEQEIFQLEIPLYLENKNYFLIEWGKKFLSTLSREIPESFSFYLLEIEVNSQKQTDNDENEVHSRNFYLNEISEL